MPTQVTNYQCPGCTGPLHFVGASGKLECEYCGADHNNIRLIPPLNVDEETINKVFDILDAAIDAALKA